MALPHPRDYPQTYGGAQQYAWAYYQAGGQAASVTFAGQTYRKADTMPGGVLYNLFKGSGAGSGGAGAGSGGSGGPPATALQAVQAGTPTPGSGGGGTAGGFQIGAVDNQVVLTQWQGEFEGLDTLSPDTRLSPGLSPDTTNWNALEKFGSRCVRRGVAKLITDRDTLQISSSAIHADYRGVSLCPMPNNNGTTNVDQLLLCGADNDGTIGASLSAQPISLWAISTAALWGRPVSLIGYPGPKLTLTEPSAGTIRVTYDYTNVWSTAGIQKISVKSVSIRYNIGSGDITHPLDMDTITDDAGPQDSTGRRAGTALKARTTWDGTSATADIDMTSQSSGTIVYVSAWAHTLLGTSNRSIAARAIA